VASEQTEREHSDRWFCSINVRFGSKADIRAAKSHVRFTISMPRDGATIFSDLIGKLDMLRVACEKCGRDGCYGLNRLIERRGRDAKLVDWLPDRSG
jgi:hypothetical protein